MSDFANTLKQRWVPIACVAVPVLLAGGMIYASMKWDASVVAKAQARISDDAKDFKSPNMTYELPPLVPPQVAIDYTGVPNEVAISRFHAARQGQMEAANQVVAVAVELNKRGKAPLVEGLLPDPPAGNQVLQREMARTFNRVAQRDLLRQMGATTPPSPADVASRVRDHQAQFLARLGPETRMDALPPEEARRLSEELLATRLDVYRSAAQRAGAIVYADLDAFILPAVGSEESLPTMAQVWDWQLTYWIQQDVTAAIASVNAEARNTGVAAATVKRLERLEVLPATNANAVPIDPSMPPPVVDQTQPDWSVSLTGRKSGPIYDVRNAKVVAVVATKDIPKVIDAIGATNLMTVLDVQIQPVDVAADLGKGFYYGPDHVSRVTFTIETLWLRGWTEALMPAEVKAGNGLIPPADPNNPGAPGAPAAPPQPMGG